MATPSLPRALGLGLLALCLLAFLHNACARPRSGEGLIGGRRDLSPSDPQVQKAAQAAVASYNMGSNSLYYFRDTNILKAQSQVRPGRGAAGGQAGTRPGRRPSWGQVKGMPGEHLGHFNTMYFVN